MTSGLTESFGEDTLLALQQTPKLIENAVLTNAAPPRDPSKGESRVLTMLAAIKGSNGIEPIKITVKQFDNKPGNNPPKNILEYFRRAKTSGGYNTLYDMRALEVVSIESAKKEFDASGSAAGSTAQPEAKTTSNSNIRVADLLDLVKGDAEKYIPQKRDVTQVSAEGQTTSHETNARSALASPSPADSVQQNTAEVNEKNGEGSTHGADSSEVSTEGEQTGLADTRGIEKDMDENTRQVILAHKKLKVVEDAHSASYAGDIRGIEALPAKAKSKVEKIIKPLAERLGILNRGLKTPDVEIEFQFSRNKGLKESLSKQLRYGGSYADFAKALVNLDRILKNAVLIEKHGDKYKGTAREDRHLESVSVLLGICRDGETIIPVQMEIKESSINGGQLYVTVAMTKIEADVLGSAVGKSQARSLISASEYSLPELFSKINPADRHFLKYVPDGFLSEAQKEAKQSALREDAARIAQYGRIRTERTGNEGAFAHDVSGDDLYQQMVEQYIAKGKLDSINTMGQAQSVRDTSSNVPDTISPAASQNVNAWYAAPRQEAALQNAGRKPRVHFDRRGKQLSAVQETALTQMEQLAVLLDVEFEVFESYVSAAGKRVYRDENGVERAAPNGWYDPATGKIHVDLNAGADGKGTMLFTVSHELTHFIRQWSPAKFDKLAEAVIELVYKEKNIRVVELVRRQQEKAARNNMELSFEEAYEEMVADSMEGILTSGNVVELMADVKGRDVTLWEKLRDWFRSLAEDIKKLVRAYQGCEPDSREGRAVASMKELLPVIEGFYADALMEASENRRGAEGYKNTTREGGVKYSYAGKTADGIEVYETSEEVKKLPWKDRKKRFLKLMRDQYRGRTAKFIRNGHSYYAKFEYRDVSKNIYGDDKSDPKGRDAKINVGADGNIFDLVENSQYSRSEIERGKTQRMHRGVNHWDYFVKTVQIDGTVFDLTANVRKKADGEFVYIIEMMENNEIEPSSPQDSQNSGRNGMPSGSVISISNAKLEVKKKLSARDSGGEFTDAQAEYFRDFEAQDDLYQQMVEQYIAGDDDRVQHRSRNRWQYSKEPADAREWSVFNRSFANKTNGLKSGGTRNIMITTADHAYFVVADGYMSGEIVAKMNLNTQMREIEEFRKGFVYADTGTKTLDSMAETHRNDRGGNDWDHAGDGYTREAGQPDVLDGRSQGSDSLGYYWENYGYPTYDELIEAIESGAMVMDDNGDLITLPDGWNQHRSDGGEYEQWLRELLAREG